MQSLSRHDRGDENRQDQRRRPRNRPITRTEGTLVQPVLHAILDELEETTARTSLDGWTRLVGLGKRFDSCRAASFDLTDRTYRVMRMTLDCGGPDRQGMLLALLATALPDKQPVRHDAPDADWHSRLNDSVFWTRRGLMLCCTG
jgi:flagellar motor switch protein FliM